MLYPIKSHSGDGLTIVYVIPCLDLDVFVADVAAGLMEHPYEPACFAAQSTVGVKPTALAADRLVSVRYAFRSSLTSM